MEKSESVANLIQFVVDSVRQAHADDAPFHHLQFDRIFPDDFYAQMLEAMPVTEDYRAMSGKSKMGSSRPDGKPTRTKLDLLRRVDEWTQTEDGTDAIFAEYGLRVRGSRQHLAFGRPGRAGGENARQHSPHLFRRCRAVAICSQSRASAGEFCAQREAQFKAQLIRLQVTRLSADKLGSLRNYFGSFDAITSIFSIEGDFARSSGALAIKACATLPFRCASRPESSANVSKMPYVDGPI